MILSKWFTWMKRTRWTKWNTGRMLAAVTAGCLAMSCLGGCGGGGKDRESDPTSGKTGGQSLGAADSSVTMGRYVETEFEIGEDMDPETVQMLQGGYHPRQLLLRDRQIYVMNNLTTDVVADWDTHRITGVDPADQPQAYRERLANGDYMTETALAGNGARMYCKFSGQGPFYYDKFFLSADGTETPWEYIANDTSVLMAYGEDGYFYLAGYREGKSPIYRVNSEDGETEYLFEADGRVGYMAVCGDKILLDTGDALQIYDVETKDQMEEDEALSGLLADYLGDHNGVYGFSFCICSGEGDGIYVATEKGLYRHVLYGNVTEQLVDGSLCSLSDVSKMFVGMCVAEEEGMPVFALIYDNGKLVSFAYDSQMPSVPADTITVYSLYEDDGIRMAISAFRASHPETYVKYEVGVDGNDGTTKEDALKNLATRLAAKEGPDVLIVDDLPYASYAEKGVLMDLGDCYAGMRTEYEFFDNVVGGMRKDGGLYAIPLTFSVPVLTGNADALSQIENAEDMVEAFRNTRVPKGISKAGLMSPMTVLHCMSFSYGAGLVKEDGSPDREAITEFLKLCREVYDADREMLSSDEEDEAMKEFNEIVANARSQQIYRQSRQASSMLLSMSFYGNRYTIGLLGGDVRTEFNYYWTCLSALGVDYMILPGVGRSCIPQTMLAVNAASPVAESAQEFVRYTLTDYVMNADYLLGTPVNKDALLNLEINPYTDEQGNPSYEPYIFFSIGSVNAEDGTPGDRVSIDVGWCRPEVLEAYNALLDSVDTVNFCDYMVIETVLEEGVKALTGERGIEDTVDAIEKKVGLYLAE